MNSRRGRGVRRCFSQWQGLFYLLSAMLLGSLFVVWLTQSSPVFSQTPKTSQDVISLSVKMDVSAGLRNLDELLQRLPMGAFVMEKDFLFCLVASSRATGGQFCLGILMEKDVLHFGALSWQNDSTRLFENAKDKEQRACLVRDMLDCPGGLWCGNHELDNPAYTVAFILEKRVQIGSAFRHQIVDVTVFQEYSHDFWISVPKTNHAVHECNRAVLAVDDTSKRFTNRLAAPETGKVMKRFAVEMLSSNLLKMPLLSPVDLESFLNNLETSEFKSCNTTSAKLFAAATPGKPDEENQAKLFRSRVRGLLMRVQRILDELNVPWWICSGTVLGWYRQCDIIPYSQDVDIGMWIGDFHPRMIELLEKRGLSLVYKLGLVNDSFQLSFVYKDTKLDVYFFYRETDHMWNGATAYHAGQKFKYIFPKIQLCWTLFLGVIVRVPCDTLAYITANYGSNWTEPVKVWDWRISPPNAVLNGYWSPEQRPDAIYLNPFYFGTNFTDDQDQEKDPVVSLVKPETDRATDSPEK